MRIFTRFLALIAAIAVIATAVIVAVEVSADRLGHQPVILNWHPWLRWAQRNTWNAGSVKVAAGILVLIGLLILITQLWPRRQPRLGIHPAGLHPRTSVALTRKGLADAVEAATQDVDGVRNSHVRLGRRRVAVRITAAGSDRETLSSISEDVRTASQHCLQQLSLARSLRIKVHAKPAKKAA